MPLNIPGFSPTRVAIKIADDTWRIKVTPPEFMASEGASITLNEDQYQRYLRWIETGCMIQDALPELSPAEREILLSGIGPDEWDRRYADEDQDEEDSGELEP